MTNKKETRSMLIGTVLGDSTLTGKLNKYIFFGHAESQKEYADWKAERISKELHVSYKSCLAKMSGPWKRQPFYKYWTLTHHKLTSIYKRMFVDGKKRITPWCLANLTPRGLAFLYMDDGGMDRSWNKTKKYRLIKNYKFCISNFPVEDVEAFSTMLKDKFDIESSVYLDRGKYPLVKITTKENREKFRNLITPYMHPSMMYKLQF